MAGVAVRTIALAQLAARELGDAPLALEEALDAVARAGAAGADLCVLPEGTYPGYVLGSADAGRAALARGPDPVATFAAAARSAGIEVVVGLVVDSPAGLRNAAVHIGRDGAVRNEVAKRFLWHFDRAWFVAGEAGRPVDGLGMLVCADGRLPEIAAGLVDGGATLLVNSTAWVVARPAPEGTNAQAEFLWRVRALESGCAAAACTKVGTEAGVAMYAGKSQIVAADGTVVAMASPTEAELLVADVDVPTTAAPRMPAPAAAPPHPPRAPKPRTGTAHVALATHEYLLGSVGHLACRLVVGPAGVVAVDDLEVHVLDDDALLAPGPARAAAFGGAEVLVWMARTVSTPYVEEVARTRALENRVFVAAWRAPDDGGPFVAAPSGAVVARGPSGRPFVVSATIFPAEAATKEVAPGTDLFAGVLELGPSPIAPRAV
jgi:predicted amidohydrolase